MSMRKERKIINTNIRLNLLDEADRQAWEYLQTMNRKKYKSYTRAVVAAVNDYFGREYEKEEDPYLETREKEDAFLRQVQNAIKEGVKESVPMLLAKNLMELLHPYMNGVGKPFVQEKEETVFAVDSMDREQEVTRCWQSEKFRRMEAD